MSNTFSVESILFKDINNNSISNTNIKVSKSIDDCVYDAYKSSEDLKFYETYTMINDYNTKQKLRMLNKLRNITKNIHNTNINNSCESYIRSIEENENNTKKDNKIVALFKFIGKAIKHFFEIVFGAIAKFFDWLSGKKNDEGENKNSSDGNSSTKTQLLAYNPSNSSNDEGENKNSSDGNSSTKTQLLAYNPSNSSNDEGENKSKLTDEEKEKKREEIRKRHEERMKDLNKNANNDNSSNTTPSMADRKENRQYDKKAVKSLDNLKESIEEFKNKYGSVVSLNGILGKKSRVIKIDEQLTSIFNQTKQYSQSDIFKIAINSRTWNENLKKIYTKNDENLDTKNIKVAFNIVFENVDESKFQDIDLAKIYSNPRIMNDLCDEKHQNYLHKLSNEVQKTLKHLKKISEDYVTLCIKVANDPRMGKKNIIGSTLNEDTSQYETVKNDNKGLKESITKDAHESLLALKETLSNWNKVEMKFNVSFATIINYFIGCQKLKKAIYKYYEETNMKA